jgi:hypothetical protein
MVTRDEDRYATLLRLVASLSRLFSDNDAPYVDSRFVERLFVLTTGSTDLGRRDISFDAQLNDIGIGVKTFLAGGGNSKREKIAEFTAYARDGRFSGLSRQGLVHEVVAARNDRVISDANEFGIDLEKSMYHCLIRMPGGAVVHEEAYGTISTDSLRPTNSTGTPITSWDEMGSGIYFTDGKNNYNYSIAKNVLMKQFVFDRNTNFIPIEIIEDPLTGLEGKIGGSVNQVISIANSHLRDKEQSPQVEVRGTEDADLLPGVDFIVLPLYSYKSGFHEVPKKSGINQWNAAGRARKLGEAYIPIPRIIHETFPEFFPKRDEPFMLKLPNRKEVVPAKVCQDGSKALMTRPNYVLGEWLIGVLRPSIGVEMFVVPPMDISPINYDDFVKIGKDSVHIVKQLIDGQLTYQIQFAPLESFEEFISKSFDSVL